MALISCPECGKEISDRALFCPACGFSRKGGAFYGFEYRSKTTWFGLPLVHIFLGRGAGRIGIAKGIIAIGDIALGFISLGGVSLGLISLGGVAIGLAAAGGCALGLGVAVGGVAVGFMAIGGAALGYYVLGPHGANTQILGLINRYVTPVVSRFLRMFRY